MARLATVPDDVRRFLMLKIPSIPHLEALVLMRESHREWTAEELASQLYVAPESAKSLLDDLSEGGLVKARNASCAFAFDPDSEELRAAVEACASFYALHVVEVSQLVHLKSDSATEQFAQAFRLRKKT